MASTQSETFLQKIIEECKVRWLRPAEVQFILENYKQLNLDVRVQPVKEPEKEEEKLKEVDKEEEEDETPLQRKRGQHGGSKDEEMEKRISEWVANLSLGEDEEVTMYIPKDEQEAAMKKWEEEEDVLNRQAMEDETRMVWKLAMMREKKRRVEAASEAVKELEEVQKLTLRLSPQVDLQQKVDIIAQSVERLARVQEQQYEFSRSQDIAVCSMRMGFRDFARELVGAVGAKVNHRLEKTERFCVGAIEGVKVAAPKEGEPRPRREPVKVSPDQHVLIAIHALRDKAASFARSLVRAANCNDDVVAYSSFTPLAEFMKLLHERFADVARSVKASDKLQTIHARKWKSARALKSTMEELVAVPDHGVTDTQLVALFYRAMPEAFRGHFFAKSEDPATTYDSLSREVVAFEAKSVSVSIFWHKDLDKGKQWEGRTISGQVKTKDSLVLTLDEGSVDEIPYDQIEWGLEEEDSGVGQGRTYAAVVAGGRPQRGGRGQGQGGRASGSRFQGDQGVGGRGGNRQAGGRCQGGCLDSFPETACVRVSLDTSLTGVAEELKERRPAWAKMKKENKGQLILVDTKIFRGRVGALVDSGATRNYISKKALQKLKLGLKVQKLADPIVSILADNRTMRVEDYAEGVQAYFRLEQDGKVEKVLHSLTLLVEDSLPFDIVLGMDWGEAAGATLHLKEHECRLPSPSGEAKTARLFHVSGVENPLAHCCLSAPAFARLVKKEKLEEQVFVAYVRPVTEPTEEKSVDPAIAKLLEEFKDLTEPPTGMVPRPIQHRIEIKPGSKTPKGVVYRMTRNGHYEFIVMPFGLTNAPATFQRCMNDLFRPWLDRFVVVYLDDILVFSKILQEHQGHLRQVLEKLREANFKINAKKCDWAKTQVLYPGHVLDGDGVKPEDCKIAAIRDWSTPRTLTELRSFLGLANYYRKFVRNFSTIAAPLRRLLRKETIWKWDKDCTSAVKKLKQAMIEYPVLKVADPSLPFVVTTDASQYGIGAVLQQDDGNGYRPVEFMPARMPSEKVATSTYERELYALRQALEHWKHYLLGRHFKVYSDHETLRWLKTKAKMTPKLTRWAAEIDQYDFELKPVKGKYNVVADALSRRADYFGAIVHYLDIGKDLQQKIREAYAQDPIYSDLLKKVKEAPETEPNYRTTEGLLFEKTNIFDHLCIPSSEEFSPLTSLQRELREIQQVEMLRRKLEKDLKDATDRENAMKTRAARLESLEADKAELEGLDESALTDPLKVLKKNMLSLHAHVDSKLDFMQSTLDQILDALTRPGFRPPAQSPLPLSAMSGPFPVQAGTQPSGTSAAPAQTVASSSSGPAVVATPPQQSVPAQGQQQGQWYPKTPMKPPLAFSVERKDEELNTWLRTVPIWVKAKRTLPEDEVVTAASYIEGKAAKWLDGVVIKAGYGRRMADWAKFWPTGPLHVGVVIQGLNRKSPFMFMSSAVSAAHKLRLEPGGRFYLFDKKTCRFFRKDGHCWQKKRDGKTVKESHEKLKVGSAEVLHCYYATGQDNGRFQRRSYWLLEEERIVLVHYLEKPEAAERAVATINVSIPGTVTEEATDLTPSTSQGLTMPQTPDFSGAPLPAGDARGDPFDETNISDVDSDADIGYFHYLALSPKPAQEQHPHLEGRVPSTSYMLNDMVTGSTNPATIIGSEHSNQQEWGHVSCSIPFSTSLSWGSGEEQMDGQICDPDAQSDDWGHHSLLQIHKESHPPLQAGGQQWEEEQADVSFKGGDLVWSPSESEELQYQRNDGKPVIWNDHMDPGPSSGDEWPSTILPLPEDHKDDQLGVLRSHPPKITLADGPDQGINWLLLDGGDLDEPSPSSLLVGPQDRDEGFSGASDGEHAAPNEMTEVEESFFQSGSKSSLSNRSHQVLGTIAGEARHNTTWGTYTQAPKIGDGENCKGPISATVAQGEGTGFLPGLHQHTVYRQQRPQPSSQQQPPMEQSSTSDVLYNVQPPHDYQLNSHEHFLSSNLQQQQQQQQQLYQQEQHQQQYQQEQHQHQYQQEQHQQQYQQHQRFQQQYQEQQQDRYLQKQQQYPYHEQQHLPPQPSSSASRASEDERGSEEDAFADELDDVESLIPMPFSEVEVPHRLEQHGKPEFPECQRVMPGYLMEGKEKKIPSQQARYLDKVALRIFPERAGVAHSPMESTGSVSVSTTPMPKLFGHVVDMMRRDAVKTGIDDEVDRQLTERLDRLLLSEDAASSIQFAKLTISAAHHRYIIEDFAPQWVFTGDHQAKVIVIGHVQDHSVRSWFCKFGDVEVEADMVRDGILRCKPPVRQKEEKVLFCVTCGDGNCCSNVRVFDYRGQGTGAENVTQMGLLIRIVKTVLSDELDNQLADEAVRTGTDRNPGALGEWEWLLRGEQSLAYVQEHLLQMLLKRRLSEWLHKQCQMSYRGQDGNPCTAVDRLDNTGMGIVHIAAALGYGWAVSILRAAQASLDSCDLGGRTPLHWAAAFGRDLTVSTLLAAGALPGILLKDTWTAAELAGMTGHQAISAMLSLSTLEQSEDMLSSELSRTGIMASIQAHEAGQDAVARAMLYEDAHEEYLDSTPQDEEEAKAAVYRAARAASRIQAVYRQYYARKKESEREVRKLFAARKIQRAYRGFQKKKLKKRTEAATKIQKVYRGWRRRREFVQKRKKIVKLQALWRGRRQRTEYRKMRNALRVIEVAVVQWRNRRRKSLEAQLLSAAQEEKDKDTLRSNRQGEEWRNVGGVHHQAALEQAVLRVQAIYRSKREQVNQFRKMMEEKQAQKEQHQAAAEAARLQAEAEAAAEKQRLQAAADTDAQVRCKEAQDLLQQHEAASVDKLKFWHFEPSEGHDDVAPEEQLKEFLSKLVTRLVYTCNHLQSKLGNLRRAVRNHKDLYEDATMALLSRVQDLEQAAPGPDAGEPSNAASTRQLEQRVDHVVAMLDDVSTFAALATISKQLDTLKIDVRQLHQPPDNDSSTSASRPYKMRTFRIKKFDDYTHQDPVVWWQGFTTEIGIYEVPNHLYISARFLNAKGGCQIWLSHMATIQGVQVSDQISWDDMTNEWKKRFIVDDAPALAINRLFAMTQGNTPTRDWLTKWQKIVATSDLELPFSHLCWEFYNRSCAALSLALGDREYDTHEKSVWQPAYVEKGTFGPRLQPVAAVQLDNLVEDPAATPASREGDQVAVVQLRSNNSRGKGEAKTASPVGNGQPVPWVKSNLTEAEYNQDFMVRAGLGPRVRRKSRPAQVTLVDHHMHKSIDWYIDSVLVYLATHASEIVSFDILDTKFDMILAMSWLRSEDHPVNFYSRTVHIRDWNGVPVPCTVLPPRPSINCHVVSAASIRASITRDDIEEMGVCYLHALPPHDISSTDPRITELLDAYGDVFEAPYRVVPDRLIRQEVVLEAGVVPPRGCIYLMSEEELSVLWAQLDDLLEKGWIRPSSSPYDAPVLFILKKNKDLRLCIDYRKLNAQTVKNVNPLPCIDDLLKRLGDAKFFSKLDLKLGYDQLEIRQEDRYKTAFKTRYGHFEWLVMPFGLMNAPATFQAAMTTEFGHMLDRFVLIYLDDILVYKSEFGRACGAHAHRFGTATTSQDQYDERQGARQRLTFSGYHHNRFHY
ncbi:hypothetical protein CBR_g40845 [Chara braunii]|uniref:RNA-directed DNA polymerase n=1 Tax=Chara braunii TaxID=69332 RepID=A0A388K276_CHABU|nr:hypothetical protein CBR_g40845 [Chara braunii]|eukprot:GBG64146.1 hypothetical protein CBR_g40845 [Chara braunii]